MTRRVITVERDVLGDDRVSAEAFRALRTSERTLVVNLLSSPGSGKTSLLAAMARHWSGAVRMAVLTGDIATDRDAQRLAPYVDVLQMTTGGACHLEIPLVAKAFDRLPRQTLDFLFIENVGNLVCPASHDVGEHLRVVLLSVTEGDDKPAKYPKMFRLAHALVVSKIDLLPYVPFDVASATSDARMIQPSLPAFAVSSVRDEGIAAWCEFLVRERQRILGLGDQQATVSSAADRVEAREDSR